MNRISTLLLALAALTAVPVAHSAGAAPVFVPDIPSSVVPASASECRAIGRRIAAENGGTLRDARVEKRGGRNMCVGLVVVPAGDGKRARQVKFSEPI